MSNSKYDKLRLEADKFFWSTGLDASNSGFFFLNGIKYNSDLPQLANTVTQAIQTIVPTVQQLVYYGHMQNFQQPLDVLMSNSHTVATVSQKWGKFKGRVLSLAAAAPKNKGLVLIIARAFHVRLHT